MKIKKLELVGFKSFVDRTVVSFDHDVLAIVGPNGCGKSNIVDAIRWCMGEQSARHLRGRSMEDVIFNGSDTRTAHEFAEVTLSFDNDAPEAVPLEYKEYGEIAVTRRLYRTGESEYLINRTPVRLRDVTDLFLGTGVGTKAYSIVEQGRIGLIVSAKPEDRRLLIEEAAGITKFKSRKKQAERKMELTQQNLLRVGDIVAEIDRNLASLKRQAAKAERYVAYRDELEDLQLHEAAHRYLELTGWMRLEQGEVDRLEERTREARTELTVREAELDVSRLGVQTAEAALDAAKNTSFAAESAVSAEEAAIERARDRLSAIAEREQQGEREKSTMDERIATLAAERDVVLCETAALAAEENEQASRVAEQESLLSDFAGAHAVAHARVSNRRQAIASAQSDIATAQTRLAAFDRRRAEIASRLERLHAEVGALALAREEDESRAGQLRRAIDDLRAKCVTTATEKGVIEERLRELKTLAAAEDRAVEDSKGELSKRRSRLAAIEEMRLRLEGVGAGTKALIDTHDPCIAGLVADRIEAPEALTHALAGLLGARLQEVVVDDVDRAAFLLEDLALRRQGRATVVPSRPRFVAGAHADLPTDEAVVARLADAVRYLPGDEALVRALIGDAIVVRDLASATRLQRSGVPATLVTLGGAVLHADGRIAGGQGDDLAAGMLDNKRETRQLHEDIERLDSIAGHHRDALEATRANLARTGTALDGARQQTHACELELLTAEKDLQKAEGERDAIVQRLVALSREEGELEQAAAEARVERDEAARSLGEAQARIESARADLHEAEAALGEAEERLEGQRQALTACKVGIAGTREKLAAARGTCTRLERSTSELLERARQLEEELAEGARSFGKTAALIVAHKEELCRALDREREAHGDLAVAQRQFEVLRGGLLDRESALRELRTTFDGLREALSGHEMALREHELAMKHLVGGVADKFRRLHLPRVVGDYHMRRPPDEVSRARLDELARLIERMGGVNLDAVREHAEAEERFTFYTTQKGDLEKALADLTRAIQQMNRESRRLFQDTFEAVNARFREVFPRMFHGGRAELRLTNPEDMLETGIDIVAQPPGKKLSNIELMSGGEKALTAASLIFAIFQIKPSPFCILDEVDAPLDEANVARYNDMVRSMTDRSQFILITHVKRTMQLADVLYGVTMGEPGVSKIVSVKINTSQTHRAGQPALEHVAVAS